MSHVVTIPCQVTQLEGVRRACERLRLAAPQHGRTRLFSGEELEGEIFQLEGWKYPCVANLQTGEVHYDNYNGAWGEQARLDEWQQAYAVETAKMTAEQQGYQVSEETLADGSIHLNVLVTH